MMDGAVSKMHWPSLVLTHTALDDMFHQRPMPQHHTLSHTPRMCSRIRHFINEEKKLSACTASSGVTYENEHRAPDGP